MEAADVASGVATRTFKRAVWLSAFLLGVFSLLALLCGTSFYSPVAVYENADVAHVVSSLRAPRVIMAILVGGALALVGAVYQALFRNPLASPFSLGVSSGAALGASCALSLGLSPTVAAIVSSIASVALIVSVSHSRISRTGETILLVGIIFSFFCSSVLTLVQYLSDYAQVFRMTRWMMGGIPVPELVDLLVGAAVVAGFVCWVFYHCTELDLMWFGDEMAKSKGVDVERLYRTAFLVTSVVVGWVVAECGVIGFVGIIVPAAVRILVGLKHRYVAPLAFLVGALLVVLCDLLGRVVSPPFEVPVGVFTAVIGGPLFLLLLVRRGVRM